MSNQLKKFFINGREVNSAGLYVLRPNLPRRSSGIRMRVNHA